MCARRSYIDWPPSTPDRPDLCTSSEERCKACGRTESGGYARIRKSSRLLSVKTFPVSLRPSCRWLAVLRAAGRVLGSMCRACVHHRCAGRGYPSCSERPAPGRVSEQAMDELARDLAARLGGPAVSER